MIVPGMYLMKRYEILEKIGSGGMADVYKAKCHMLNRLVAIKVLKQEYSSDATFVKKFRVEAQSAAGLSHPNIVNVYDVGEDHGIQFIVMELVQGITLKNYIEMKGKLGIKEALNISVQIASGLSAAHDNRIIHRDIKPQNIIMSRDGKVKVTDFGIAKMADSTTVTTTAAGTVYYISPEQARGGYSDEKSDIYSLGITMYEMLTGRVPFEGETNVAVALLHIQGEMTPPRALEPAIPRSFEKIILKCTQKKPDLRYTSARALIADLRKVLVEPDGAYISLAPSIPTGGTIVMDDKDLDSIRAGRKISADTKVANKDADISKGERKTIKNSVKTSEKSKNQYEEDDEDEEDDSEGLSKIMMGLGIGGFVILAVIVFFIIGHAMGLFGGNRQKESNLDSINTESQMSETEDTFELESLIGKTEDEARKILSEAGLGILIERGASDDYPEGQVFEQSPKAGEAVKKHDQVTVYISSGKESFSLDDVINMDYKQAADKLESQGLVVEYEFENSSSVDKDKVIRTNPVSGTQVVEGDRIIIYASAGAEIVKVSVPDVRGLSLDEAIEKIEQKGLIYNGRSSDYSDIYPEGKVMSQSLTPEKQVEEGTSMTLTVSLGSKVRFYSSTVIIPSPFGCDFPDKNGEVQVYEEGEVKIVLTQNGSSKVIYNQYTTSSQLPASIDITSESSESATAELFLNGQKFDSWTVTFH